MSDAYIDAKTTTYALPLCNLLIRPDTRHVGHAPGLCRDECCFRDEKGARFAGSLGVVLRYKTVDDVLIGNTKTSERSVHDAVLQSQVADSDRLEELRVGHAGRPVESKKGVDVVWR
jgi:hypothetical protein